MKKNELILDSLRTTGIYVIREDNHEVLYYNKRMKEIVPGIKEGMVCHELWNGRCLNCPLPDIGDKKEAHCVHYEEPSGKAVEITATRILWEDEVPAFMIETMPQEKVANYVYYKVVQGNLSTDRFHIIKADEKEIQDMQEHLDSLSAWFENIALDGYIYDEDIERYRKFVQPARLGQELQNGTRILTCVYRRRVGDGFRWHTLEIVPDCDYTDENQTVMIYVKDVHDIFRDGLEREELNIRNQEIISSLGEMNFAIYVVDLQSGGVNIVRTTDLIRQKIKKEIFLWDDVFNGRGVNYIASEDQKEFAHKFSLNAMWQAWKNGEEKRMLVCQAFLHGEWHYICVSAFFKNNSQHGGYAILSFQDVDERTKREMERAKNDRRIAAIIKTSYSIINTVDLETGICERIYLREGNLGRRLEGSYSYYIQRALTESVAEKDQETFKNVFLLENLRKKAEQVKDFKEEICQYQIKRKPAVWVEEHIFYMRQGNKTVVNILGRDITDEKLVEEYARKEVLEKVSIINSLSSMFFATYYVNLERDSFRPVLQKAEVGSTIGEERNYTKAIRMYAENFVHEDDREYYLKCVDYEYLLQTLSDEHPITAFEYRMVPDENNKRSWIRASLVLAETTSDGRPKRALYVAQDVTESKLREEQEQKALREACEAANHANEAKSEFMSRMSHDIRTPMNAIIGMTAIAGKYLDDRERVADCLGKITVSSRHLLSLINEVLDMSKIESGKIELTEEEINLPDLIENLVTMIRPSIQGKKQDFNMSITNVEHEHVISDSVRLQQIFMNIMGNAVKYTPEGGNIEMEIHEKPSGMYGYGCYEFVFRDNGIGMSREFLERMFEPFSRAEDSRVSKIEGTGLGMTIARNIARRMNGDITVESELGKGTQFVVMLTLRLADTTAPDTEKFAGLPVLVVDEDEADGEKACLVLENIGMKGEYVTNGRKAVERIWEQHQAGEDYFAVILAWKMSEMDGMDTAHTIREKVGRDLPIIILTAYDWSDVEEEANGIGVNGFISKPLFKSRLIYLLNQMMENGREQQQTETDFFATADLKGKRLLLAEDNELNREIAEEILSQTGVEMDSVENGKEAVEQFEKMGENYYDIILMDVQMPFMNGYEATAAIRKLPRRDAATIPIIAMTANAFAEDIQQSKMAGMNEHLMKPIDVKQLMKCLQTWLGKKG
ncbi:MAG: response regulator [Clostridium sp.]|nr:response regulator [Clostridium sp.]